MSHEVFPPNEGWCVEVVTRESGAIVCREVFALAEDARDFAKQHVWQHKGDVATIFERQSATTVFTTEIAFPSQPL